MILRVICFVSLWSGIALAAPHPRTPGPGDGGGGDEVGVDFEAALQSAIEIVHVSGRAEFAPLDRLDFAKIVAHMNVMAVEKKLFVEIGGVRQESTALNFPSTGVIEVNRLRWKALKDARMKEGLALHETLSLAKLESTGVYPYSGLYLSLFNYAPGPILGGAGNLPPGPAAPAPWPSAVAKIYPYQCERRFVEGEGVNPSSVSCVPGQHLGFLTANYTFYLYASPARNNFASQLHEVDFPAGICGLNPVPEITCGEAREPSFGLAASQEGPFVVGISMTAAPSGPGPLTELFGYAALPDSLGRCPANLVKARPWVAEPASVIEPLPTSFVNGGGFLNDTQVAVGQPGNFEVWRTPNSVACDSIGHCAWPQGGHKQAESVAYIPETPIVCVIPKEAL